MNTREKNQADSGLAVSAASEADCKHLAGEVARAWRAQAPGGLVVGLEGPLGAGKTTWVRGMLEGLGYRGKVPSPTYTLLEHYDLGGLTVVHLDLYRLPETGRVGAEAPDEFEALGVRDWLARSDTWLLAEWPGRSPQLVAQCDVRVDFEFLGAEERRVTLAPRSTAGEALVQGLRASSSLDSSLQS